jgi:hypothetical protein
MKHAVWRAALFRRERKIHLGRHAVPKKHFTELPVISFSPYFSDGMDMTPLMCSVFPAGASNARQSKA